MVTPIRVERVGNQAVWNAQINGRTFRLFVTIKDQSNQSVLNAVSDSVLMSIAGIAQTAFERAVTEVNPKKEYAFTRAVRKLPTSVSNVLCCGPAPRTYSPVNITLKLTTANDVEVEVADRDDDDPRLSKRIERLIQSDIKNGLLSIKRSVVSANTPMTADPTAIVLPPSF